MINLQNPIQSSYFNTLCHGVTKFSPPPSTSRPVVLFLFSFQAKAIIQFSLDCLTYLHMSNFPMTCNKSSHVIYSLKLTNEDNDGGNHQEIITGNKTNEFFIPLSPTQRKIISMVYNLMVENIKETPQRRGLDG